MRCCLIRHAQAYDRAVVVGPDIFDPGPQSPGEFGQRDFFSVSTVSNGVSGLKPAYSARHANAGLRASG